MSPIQCKSRELNGFLNPRTRDMLLLKARIRSAVAVVLDSYPVVSAVVRDDHLYVISRFCKKQYLEKFDRNLKKSEELLDLFDIGLAEELPDSVFIRQDEPGCFRIFEGALDLLGFPIQGRPLLFTKDFLIYQTPESLIMYMDYTGKFVA